MKKIGIDFDNTLVIYDQLFYKVAIERNLIPLEMVRSKLEIRNFLRSIGKDDIFTSLQSEVYGKRILEAPIAKNAFSSIKKIMENYEVFIISHKTKYPFSGEKYDLHNAALSWLKKINFYQKKV